MVAISSDPDIQSIDFFKKRNLIAQHFTDCSICTRLSTRMQMPSAFIFIRVGSSHPCFNPERMSGRSRVSPPGGSGIPHSNKRRFPEPPYGWVLVLTHHLAAAVDRVGAKTQTRREFGRLLASPTTGYWSNPPRRGGPPSGQQ